jgi:hypothetical protein
VQIADVYKETGFSIKKVSRCDDVVLWKLQATNAIFGRVPDPVL